MAISYKNKAENAIAWAMFLHKTDYKQNTNGKLGDLKSGFCCLGVGCHIFSIKYKKDDEVSSTFRNRVGLLNDGGLFYDPFSFHTPWKRIVPGKFKIKVYGKDDFYNGLADANDRGVSFKRIAKWISKRPETLFHPKVATYIKDYFKDNPLK